MAFFKFRLPGQASAAVGRRDPAPATAQAESVEVIRRRARHRLIGATVLVLIAVIGFPLLFDTQPRPVSVDVPISIPDRSPSRPSTVPAASPAPAAPPVEAKPVRSDAQARPAPKNEAVSTPAAADKAVAESVASGKAPAPAVTETRKREAPAVERAPSPPRQAVKTEAPPRPVASAKPAERADDGNRARALLEGKQVTTAAADDRLVLQVGAYSDAAKAREVRQKLEKAGLKTYMQVVDGRDGKRIRVRVGPFDTKAEADRAANRIRKLDLPVALLSL